jgi:hypothetical protein
MPLCVGLNLGYVDTEQCPRNPFDGPRRWLGTANHNDDRNAAPGVLAGDIVEVADPNIRWQLASDERGFEPKLTHN